MKKVKLDDDHIIDEHTPRVKIYDMLQYLIKECEPGTDHVWELSKLLLNKEDVMPKDLILVFTHFNTYGFSRSTNNQINKLAKKSWEKLKSNYNQVNINNEDLIAIAHFNIRSVALEAWQILLNRPLTNQEFYSLIFLGGYGNRNLIIKFANQILDLMSVAKLDFIRRSIATSQNKDTIKKVFLKPLKIANQHRVSK